MTTMIHFSKYDPGPPPVSGPDVSIDPLDVVAVEESHFCTRRNVWRATLVMKGDVRFDLDHPHEMVVGIIQEFKRMSEESFEAPVEDLLEARNTAGGDG